MVIAAPALNFQPQQATLPVKSFLQRLLLVTDGNIADIIQAYAGEEIESIKLHQKLIANNFLLNQLQLDSEQDIIENSIVLQGRSSKTNYLYAKSYLVLERLQPEIRRPLIFNRSSLEDLLQESNLEIYRQIIDCGIKPVGKLAKYFALESEAMMIYRTYLILINGLPTIQITEQFPQSHFIN